MRCHERARSVRGLRGLASVAFATAALGGCGGELDSRGAEIASVTAQADMALIRTRPALVAGKYARMADDPYAFFRGTLPLYLHDWRSGKDGAAESRFAGSAPRVLSIGDAHVENFGALRARDGSFGLESNDFDSAGLDPYLWDVRRLTTSVALAARLSNPEDEEARSAAAAAEREIAVAAARAYAEAIAKLADGAPRERESAPGEGPVLNDLFERSEEDTATRAELEELTVVLDGTRRLRRGSIDPEDPSSQLLDLPEACEAALKRTIEGYRGTLGDPPEASFFEILDAAREMGSGVASFPRVRVLVLVEGPTPSRDDDVILEVKELADAIGPGHAPPDVELDSVPSRVRVATAAAWGGVDAAPLWGVSEMLGFPVQIRLESAGQKTIRIRKLTGKRGTTEALVGLAEALGRLVARVHASPLREGDPAAAADVAAAIGPDLGAFADEQADAGVRGAERAEGDHLRFRTALFELGPTLGIVPDETDRPSPELSALYNGLPGER